MTRGSCSRHGASPGRLCVALVLSGLVLVTSGGQGISPAPRLSRAPRVPGAWCLLGGVKSLGVKSALASPRGQLEKAETTFRGAAERARTMSGGSLPEPPADVEARLAEVARLLAARNYELAVDQAGEVVELGARGQATGAQLARAEFSLGEAYFLGDQLYSAERWLGHVAAAGSPDYRAFRGRAVARLVDIALGTQRAEKLPEILALADRVLAETASEEAAYGQAKALLANGRFAEAAMQASRVTSRTLLGMRARYLRGTALMKEAQARPGVLDYSAAVHEFRAAAQGTSPKGGRIAQEIRDLSWLAVARLHFETARFTEAARAYLQVQSGSQHFPTALFELGWTYVRMGDFRRAEKSLEVLSVRNPGLIDGAEAALLRADLMLRSGRFKDAEKVYEHTRDLYGPLQTELERFLVAHPEPDVYYDKLIASEIEVGHELPKLIVDWAREQATEERSFALVDLVLRTRELIERGARSSLLARATLASGAHVRAFPVGKQRLVELISLQNELARARLELMVGLDEVGSRADDALRRVRDKRSRLMRSVRDLPTSSSGFSKRERHERRVWEETEASLLRIQLSLDQMQALANGLRRVLSDAAQGLVVMSPARRREFSTQLAHAEQQVRRFRGELGVLRRDAEVGRHQAGFFGERSEKDAQLRSQFRSLVDQELRLAAQGLEKKGGARAYARGALDLAKKMNALEETLERSRTKVAEELRVRAAELGTELGAQAEAFPRFEAELAGLDAEARALVGEIARQSFEAVKERLRSVILRADIGLVQKSWEVREERRRRVRRLQRERAEENQRINQELNEVLDEDGGGL